jgi:photosystem II stability/assembly factor-like uncharacterized protein
MKQCYVLIITCILVTDAMAQWVTQNSGITKNLSSVYFKDANTGYVVGDSGTILKTTDGGLNWSSLTVVSENDLFFTDGKRRAQNDLECRKPAFRALFLSY